jgi:DUF971 family protein
MGASEDGTCLRTDPHLLAAVYFTTFQNTSSIFRDSNDLSYTGSGSKGLGLLISGDGDGLKIHQRIGYSDIVKWAYMMNLSNRPARPVEIVKEEDKAIRVKWEDGHVGVYPNAYLRLKCRCASCVQEWTGEVMVNPEMIPSDITPLKISPVGNYAIHIHWSDGHETGIYAFALLREICPCEQCGKGKI